MMAQLSNDAVTISLRILAAEELARALQTSIDWVVNDTGNMSNYEFFQMYERLAAQYDLKALPM